MSKLLLTSLACYGVFCLSLAFPILGQVAFSFDTYGITYRIILIGIVIFLGMKGKS